MSIDGLHGKPNSTRFILYRNHYNEKGLLCWTEGIKELKTGKWNKVHSKAFLCSECKRMCEFSSAFCPHCGAIMEGIDETD